MTNELKTKEYYLRILKDKEKIFQEITRLSEDEKREYEKILEHLITVNENRKSYTTKEKGKALEDIVKYILDKTSVFEALTDIHNSTNEIDEMVSLNYNGKELAHLIDIRGDQFIGECKNHDSSIGVTWVGKVYSLLQTNSCNLGVIFSYLGLSGKKWNGGTGLTKKLFLLREDPTKRVYILDFNIEDFKNIGNGHSFLELLEAKMKALKNDTDFHSYIQPHPGEKNKT